MATYEPDRDYGDENAYEQRPDQHTGLCLACCEDEALPDGDFCRYCTDELADEEPAA